MIVGQYYTGHIIFLLCRTDIKISFLHVCINHSPPSNFFFFFAPVFTNVSRSASYSVLLVMASESLQKQMRIFFLVVFQYVATKRERVSGGVIGDVSTLLPSHSGKWLEVKPARACKNHKRS